MDGVTVEKDAGGGAGHDPVDEMTPESIGIMSSTCVHGTPPFSHAIYSPVSSGVYTTRAYRVWSPKRARGAAQGGREVSNRWPASLYIVRSITPTGPVAAARSRAAVGGVRDARRTLIHSEWIGVGKGLNGTKVLVLYHATLCVVSCAMTYVVLTSTQ